MFWIVYDTLEGRIVVIQPAKTLLYARLIAEAGKNWEFVEGHELDAKSATKVPKKMIGRVLNRDEAAKLLERLG